MVFVLRLQYFIEVKLKNTNNKNKVSNIFIREKVGDDFNVWIFKAT